MPMILTYTWRVMHVTPYDENNLAVLTLQVTETIVNRRIKYSIHCILSSDEREITCVHNFKGRN